jgi:hypothetical protein
VSILKTLHKSRRGTWIYQSPRITLILIYAKTKGLNPGQVLERHLDAVSRLGEHQRWILDKLEWLGYRSKRGSLPNINELDHYQEALGLNVGDIVKAMDVVLKVFNSGPDDVFALPPILTLPEKLVIMRAITSTKSHFDFLKTMKILLARSKDVGDPDTFRRELRFRRTWLYSLHLIDAERPTCLGYAVAFSMEAGEDAAEAYVVRAGELGLLKWIIALEAAALDVGTKNELDNLLSAYDDFVRDYVQVKVDLGEVYSAFRYMASDVGGITMATPALPIEEVLRRLGMGA